jgi:hypothetical protein
VVANDFETKYEEIVVTYAKLLENFELLKNDSRVISSEPITLMESHKQLKASNSNELTKLHSLLSISDDACATNSTSCEASIFKENVELRAQLDLLTSNYGKLEEKHGKLSCSFALLLKIPYYHVLVLVIHLLIILLHLVMNYFPCLVALKIKLLLPLVLVLLLTM